MKRNQYFDHNHSQKALSCCYNITHLHCIVHSIPMECCYMQLD